MAETYFKNEVEKFQYFQLPKWLFKEPYKKLSNNAKIMYALLYNRLDLSLESKWHDRNGKVFMYFTTAEFCEELGCSEKTVTKIKKELVTSGLLKEERQGLTKPNRLYILGPKIVKQEPPELEKIPPRTVENTSLDTQEVQTIKTDIIKTDIDNNKLLICKEVISYLNLKAKKNFKVDTASHQKFIKARLKEGYVLEDFKKVVDIMVAKWKGTEYEQYLQPQTLFGNKMDNYLNQPMPRKVHSFQSAVDERLGF
jgi:hypothetical protein|nr:MAG TPA: replication initiator protein [Caudoviricetes sp.]DAY15733.1 MAG TPA: replication initiator protein [Caudoviricetes sp.]